MMQTNNKIVRVAQIELNSMFYSPIAWLVLVIFAFQVGLTYAQEMDTHIHTQALGYGLFGATSALFSLYKGIFPAIIKYLYLYIPLITMGLMSKEYGTGTIKLLYSSPIKNSSIILGKFVAMMVYGLSLIAIIFVYFIFTAFTVESMDWQLVLAGMLGIYLLLCVYSAIGLFMSTLTSYQVVVAMGTLVVLGFLNYVGDIGQDIDFIRVITYWLSMTGRVQDMIKGLISSEDVIYFLTIIFMFLSLSVLVLQSKRISNNRGQLITKFAGLFAIVISIAYITSRPVCRFYVDAAYTQKNTLSKQSQEVISQLTGPLKITSYVNIFGGDVFLGLPRYMNADMDYFERYLRFKPKMEIDYVYYFHKPEGRVFDKYPDKTDREVAESMCKKNGINPKKLLSKEEVDKIVDLSGEGYNFVRVIERGEDGARSILRVYDDKEKLPKESEITIAMKRLIEKAPLVTFVEGHTDRTTDAAGGRGFNMFSIKKSFRNALVNQGFDVCSINLSEQEIPQECSILVIADLKTPLGTEEMAKVKHYIDKGGNLYIFADKDRHLAMNPIVEPLGVYFEDGVVVEPIQDLDPTLIGGTITREATKMIPSLAEVRGYKMVMPSTLEINYENAKEFTVVPVVTTTNYAWSEKVTTDFVEYTPECLESEGETMKRCVTVAALNRKVGEKEQRIVISGDADCVSDQEFTTFRPFHKANFVLISAPFMWLTEGKYPVFPVPIEPIDNKVSLTLGVRTVTKIMCTALPATILLVLGLFIIIRRQKG